MKNKTAEGFASAVRGGNLCGLRQLPCSHVIDFFIHNDRMFAERAFYYLCAAFKIGLSFL